MARKPKLPGAEDFFSTAKDAEEGAGSQKPSRKQKGGKRAPQEAAPAQAETPQPESISQQPASLAGSEPPPADRQLDLARIGASQTLAPPRTLPQPDTEKVTFYVPAQMLQQLEVCRVRLLTEHGIKANRSQIAQAAMAVSIYDPDLIARALLELARAWAEPSEE